MHGWMHELWMNKCMGGWINGGDGYECLHIVEKWLMVDE